MTDQRAGILKPGTTCWRVAKAHKVAVIVDAAAYFAAAKAAMLNAKRSVLLIGWDFDARIKLEPDKPASDVPDELGKFLGFIVKRRPEVQVRVLRWDLSILKRPFRGRMSLLLLNWTTSNKLKFRLDHGGPLLAARHQKIVVVDDSIAFCGGIDMTTNRWDTPAHSDTNPYRMLPSGEPYGPWHDVTTAVDGEAARALGYLAREWWQRATGENLLPPSTCDACWPDWLEPTFRSVNVAIARTEPGSEDAEAVQEVKELYLAAIRSAERSIYLETQYFASSEIVQALCERLSEEMGPEIIVINPVAAEGWLEDEVMSSARAILIDELQRADRWGRFGIFTPKTERGNDIYVHAKVLVVDDNLLRVGSSNVNNRSLGVDTECDLAVEVHAGEENAHDVRRRIAEVRNNLLSEHLGVAPEELERAVSIYGSLLAATRALLKSGGRTLAPLVPPDLNAVEKELARSRLLDPRTPEDMAARTTPPSIRVALATAGAALLAFSIIRFRALRKHR
jgi:phospholipase D1/2